MKRKSLQIRGWMVGKGLSVTALAKKIGISRPKVSQTIYGWNNNRRVLAALVEAGCPKELLALPEDMKAKTRRAA